MRLIINLTAAIALLCVLADHVIADSDDTTNTTVPNQTQNNGTDWSQVSRMAKNMMCFLSCRGHISMPPPDCVCPGRQGCESMKCDVGKSCKILKGRFATCVKDSSVCDQPSSSVACGQGMMKAHYWNKATMNCERLDRGQCSDNDNGFISRRECMMTCGSKIGMGALKGLRKRNKNRFRSRRPGRRN